MAPTKTVEAQVVLSLGDRLTAGLNRIQARINRLTTGLGLQRLTSSLGNLGGRLSALGPAIGAVAGRLGALTGLLGVGVGGAAAAAFDLTKGVADVGAELTESAFKLGIGVEALQEYRYAANMAGIENEVLNTAFQKLGINAANAANGNKGMADTFRALGVSVKDSAGNMRSTESILNDTMAALAAIEDPAKRNAAAFKVFGKSGVDLVKMLADGEEGLIGMREEARRMGFVMSESAAAMGDEFGDNVDRLMKRLEGLKLFLGVQLLPVFNELVTSVTEWVAANSELVRSTISDWVQRLAGFLRDLMNPTSELRTGMADLAERVTGFYNAISPVIDLLGGPGMASLVALGTYIAGPLIAAVLALIPPIISLGAAMLTTPVGWVIGGMALIGAAIYALVTNWDAVVAAWNGAWDTIKNGLAQFGADFMAKWEEVKTEIGSAFEDVRVAFVDSWAGVVAWGQGLADQIRGWFTVDLYAVGVAIVQSLLNGITSAWGQVTGFINTKLAELASIIPDWAKGPLGIEIAPTIKSDGEIEDLARQAGEAAKGQVASPGGMFGWGAKPEEVAAAERAKQEAFDNAYAAEIARLQIQNAQLRAQQGGPGITPNAPITAPSLDVQPPAPPAMPSATGQVQAQEVEASAVNAGVLNVPEPIVAHVPQQVTATQSVALTVNVQGMTPAEGQAMVRRALAQASSDQAAAVTSALND